MKIFLVEKSRLIFPLKYCTYFLNINVIIRERCKKPNKMWPNE